MVDTEARVSTEMILTVVLPAHNEADNVNAMAERLTEIVRPLGAVEIIFVDDGSTDGTLAALKALAARDRTVGYVSFTRNFGHQAALRAGLRHARGQAVILMDCDLQHPPELIPSLLAEWRRGAAVVTTRRLEGSGGEGAMKRLASRLFYRLMDAISDVDIEPGSADFLLLDRRVVNIVNEFYGQDVLLRGLVRWLGFPLASVSYEAAERRHGRSKYNLGRMAGLAAVGIVSHSLRPLRLAIYLAFAFVALGLILLVYSVVSFLWISRTVVGWSSLMATIAIINAAQMLVLGIVGEYVGRGLREVRRWPLYVVAETSDGAPQEGKPPDRGCVRLLAEDASLRG